MSENQQAPETTDIEYTNKDGIAFDISIPGKLNDEEIQVYLEKAVPEIEMAEGLREPGFGPVTMDFVPTESIEQGLYGARQVGATLGTELGLLDKETASEDIAKMERYKEYSREQARREDFASGDIVVDPMTGRQVREGELEYYRDRDTLQNLAKAETFSDAISTFADNPGAVLPIIGESLGLFAPALIGTAAVGILTGGSGVPGIVATALAGGLGSGTTEYGSSFLQSFAENGVDVSDDEQVLAALNDETTLDSIREDAAKRGIAIGAFDAATIGFAGKLTTLIKGAPLAKATAEASLGRRLGAGGAEAGAQALGGGGGEATAQALTGEYKPGEILLEAVAEIPTTLPEVALGARAGRTRKLRNALVNKGYTDEQIEQFGSMTGNEQNKIIKELNEAPASTTFPSQRQMDREAENVTVTGISDTGEEVQRVVPRADQEIEIGRATEASEFTETSMLEDLYAEDNIEIIEEVDSSVPVTAEELSANLGLTEPQARDLFTEEADGIGQTDYSTDTSYSVRVEMTPEKFLKNAEPLDYDPKTEPEKSSKSGTVNFTMEEAVKLKEGKEHKKLGIPFITLQWNNETKTWKPNLDTHEGRHRVLGIENVFGPDAKVPVNVRLQKENGNKIPIKELTGEANLYALESKEQAAEMKEALDVWSAYAESSPATIAKEEKQTKETTVNSFVEQPFTEQEVVSAQEGTSLDLNQNKELVDSVREQAKTFGVPEENLIEATYARLNKLVEAAENKDNIDTDPDSVQPRTQDGKIILSEKEAIQQTGNQLAQSGGPVTPTLAGRVLKEGEYNEYGAMTVKDLNGFARWWNFPDVMAERYPAFAPFWNAVNLQRQITSLKLTDYMMPMADPLKKLKSTQSQLGVMQALELLDQMGKDALPKYATNGKLDPSKMRDPANPDQYILVNEGGENVKTTLTKGPTDTTGGDKIFLDQDQLDALLAIRESFGKTKADIMTAFNSNFYFGPDTTVTNLNDLIAELKEYTNQTGDGSVTISTENQEAALQAIKDSPLINTDDPKSIFRTETDPAKLIQFIGNYKNTLAVYEANPFYFAHQRYGSVAFIVTEQVTDSNGNINKQNVWVETHKPQAFRKNLLTVDFNSIENTKKYKEINARLKIQYGDKKYTIQRPKNFDTSFKQYTENVNTDNIGEMLSRIADVQMESLTKEQNKAVADFLDKARNTLLTTKGSTVDPDNFIQRLNIPGWIREDNAVEQMNDTINIYMGKVAGYVANEETRALKTAAIDQLEFPPEGPDGKTKAFPKLAAYAKRLDDYMNDGYRDVLNLKRLSFHYFLGLNPSSAIVNLTQIPMATIPWLVRFSPATSAQLEVMRAMKDAGKIAGLLKGLKRTGTGSVNELLKLDYPLGKSNEARQLWDDMKIDLQNSRLMAQVTAEQAGLINYGQFQAGKSAIRNAENISSSIFSYVELLNRMTTYIAAHRTYTKAANKGTDSLAKLEKKLETNADYKAMRAMPDYIDSSDARKFAAFSVDKTQFLMGADNRPEFMRGAIPSVIFQFMQFPVRYLQMIDSLVFREGGVVKNPKERAAALAYMAAFMMMTGGFWSLPLAENAVDLGELVYKGLYKTDPMIKAELDKALFQMGMENPSYFTRGVVPQLANISLTSRTGAGRLLQPDMFSGDFSKTIGPAGSMIFGSAAAAIQAIHNDNYFMALANMMPTAMYNVMKATKMGATGQIKTSRQNRVMLADEISAKQVIPQIIGFQPEDVSQQMLYEFNIRRRNTRVTELQSAFGNKIKSNLTDAYRFRMLYDQSVARKAPAPILLQRSKEAYKEVAKYMKQMEEYNLDAPHPSLMLNTGNQTFKSWGKNAAAQAQGRPKLGRKLARHTAMMDNYLIAPYPQKLKMIREGFQPYIP